MTTSRSTTAWGLSGTYFESCKCDTASPCVFLSEPTDGKQSDALTRIFTTIDFRADGRRRSLRIGEGGTSEIEGVEGQQGHHGLDRELSDKNRFFPLRLPVLTARA